MNEHSDLQIRVWSDSVWLLTLCMRGTDLSGKQTLGKCTSLWQVHRPHGATLHFTFRENKCNLLDLFCQVGKLCLFICLTSLQCLQLSYFLFWHSFGNQKWVWSACKFRFSYSAKPEVVNIYLHKWGGVKVCRSHLWGSTKAWGSGAHLLPVMLTLPRGFSCVSLTFCSPSLHRAMLGWGLMGRPCPVRLILALFYKVVLLLCFMAPNTRGWERTVMGTMRMLERLRRCMKAGYEDRSLILLIVGAWSREFLKPSNGWASHDFSSLGLPEPLVGRNTSILCAAWSLLFFTFSFSSLCNTGTPCIRTKC